MEEKMIIKGSSIEKVRTGSLENKIEDVSSIISEKYKDVSFSVLATYEDKVTVLLPDGTARDISYSINEDGKYSITSDRSNKSVGVVADEDITADVSNQLNGIVKSIIKGKGISRTQVRELASMVSKDETYWMSDILSLVESTMSDSEWSKMYEANTEKVRTGVYGSIRAIESNIPKTRYSLVPKDKMGDFAVEVKESIVMIKDVFSKIVEDCKGNLAFRDKDEFLNGIRESLLAEAQAVVDLLGKADKLQRQDNLPIVAGIHDKLAERAKTAAVTSEYLMLRAKPGEQGV
jgi:hypothetical protein